MSDLIKRELNSFITFAKTKGIIIEAGYVTKYLKSIESEKDNDEIIEVFTDGSVINNGKRGAKGGYGVFISDSENYSFEYEEEFEEGPATNQKTELLAIHHAINKIRKKNFKNVVIYSDSMYSINCLTKWKDGWIKNGWKSSVKTDVKNKNLIKDILRNISESNKNIIFKHVRSHRFEPRDKNSKEYKLWYGNDMADKLAKQGMLRRKN